MCFVHHAAVTGKTLELLHQILADYDTEHPGVIIRHAVGFLGHYSLIFATENIAAVVRRHGIPCYCSQSYDLSLQT